MRGLGCVFLALVVFLAAVALFAWWLSRRKPRERWEPQIAPLPKPEPTIPPPLVPTPVEVERVAVEVSLPGLKIVGESHYQEALEEIVGGRTDESADFEVDLSLVPESDNEYDPNAVGVEIDGELVGYLSRASAKKYRAAFGAATTHEWPARIVGGWDRGDGDRGSFGVQMVE